MVEVKVISPDNVRDVYRQFLKIINTSPLKVAQMILYVGDPTGDEISWCPPCRKSHPDFMKAAEGYTGNLAQLYTVPVGPEEEWVKKTNEFKMFYPHLETVPTVEIYIRFAVEGQIRRRQFGRLLRPRFDDFMHLLNKYIPEKIAELD